MGAITITGDNEFVRRAELQALTDAFVAEQGDLALERIDVEEADFARLQEAVTSLPFLANKKMVIVRSPGKSKQLAEHIDAILDGLPETTDLVFYEPKFDKRSSLYKTLKKRTEYREYTALDHARLSRWATEQAKAQGATLGQADARYLVDRIGLDQQMLMSEIEKLSLLGGAIDRERIDDLTEAAPQTTIFQLIDAAFAGNADRAIRIYDEQRRLGVEPQQIVAMFSWQLHSMAVVKAAGSRSAGDIAKAAKLNPYVVGKTQTLVRSIPLGRLIQMLDSLLDIDRRSKRQAIDLDEAMRYYVLELASADLVTK